MKTTTVMEKSLSIRTRHFESTCIVLMLSLVVSCKEKSDDEAGQSKEDDIRVSTSTDATTDISGDEKKILSLLEEGAIVKGEVLLTNNPVPGMMTIKNVEIVAQAAELGLNGTDIEIAALDCLDKCPLVGERFESAIPVKDGFNLTINNGLLIASNAQTLETDGTVSTICKKGPTPGECVSVQPSFAGTIYSHQVTKKKGQCGSLGLSGSECAPDSKQSTATADGNSGGVNTTAWEESASLGDAAVPGIGVVPTNLSNVPTGPTAATQCLPEDDVIKQIYEEISRLETWKAIYLTHVSSQMLSPGAVDTVSPYMVELVEIETKIRLQRSMLELLPRYADALSPVGSSPGGCSAPNMIND